MRPNAVRDGCTTITGMMVVSLAEAMWRTKLATSLPDMRALAEQAGALLPDDRVDLRMFLGERTAVPLERVTVAPLAPTTG